MANGVELFVVCVLEFHVLGLNAIALRSWNIARNGNVTSSRLLRPKVSIVLKAGNANVKFSMPTPIDH